MLTDLLIDYSRQYVNCFVLIVNKAPGKWASVQ